VLKTIRHLLELIRFIHTLFALPFAMLAAPALASIVAVLILFQPYDVPTGLYISLALCQHDGDDRLIVLHITEAGKLFLNNTQENWDTLQGRLSQIYGRRVDRTLYLLSDDGVPFQTVAHVLDIVESTAITAGPQAVRMRADELNITVRLITPAAMDARCVEPL